MGRAPIFDTEHVLAIIAALDADGVRLNPYAVMMRAGGGNTDRYGELIELYKSRKSAITDGVLATLLPDIEELSAAVIEKICSEIRALVTASSASTRDAVIADCGKERQLLQAELALDRQTLVDAGEASNAADLRQAGLYVELDQLEEQIEQAKIEKKTLSDRADGLEVALGRERAERAATETEKIRLMAEIAGSTAELDVAKIKTEVAISEARRLADDLAEARVMNEKLIIQITGLTAALGSKPTRSTASASR